MGEMQSTLEEMQKTQSTLVNVMTNIQDHVIQDGDQDRTSNVDEKPLKQRIKRKANGIFVFHYSVSNFAQ